MTTVLDASAMLAFLQDEPGSAAVEAALTDSVPVCSAVNWSEVAQKIKSAGADWVLSASLLGSYGLVIENATSEDAERAANLWTRGGSLSLGDRFCLALAERLDAQVLTADTAWGTEGRIRQIR